MEMTKERLESLVSDIIDYVAISTNISEQIEILREMGFRKDDLVYFGYSEEDLKDVEEQPMLIDYQGIMVNPETEQIRLNERDVTILPTGEVLIKSEIIMGIGEVNEIFDRMAALANEYEDKELSARELWDMATDMKRGK